MSIKLRIKLYLGLFKNILLDCAITKNVKSKSISNLNNSKTTKEKLKVGYKQ